MKNNTKSNLSVASGLVACFIGMPILTNGLGPDSKRGNMLFYNPPALIQSIHKIDSEIWSLEYCASNSSYYARQLDSLLSYNSKLEATINEVTTENINLLNKKKDSLMALPNYNRIKEEYEVDFNHKKNQNILYGSIISLFGIITAMGGPLLFLKPSKDKTKKT